MLLRILGLMDLLLILRPRGTRRKKPDGVVLITLCRGMESYTKCTSRYQHSPAILIDIRINFIGRSEEYLINSKVIE